MSQGMNPGANPLCPGYGYQNLWDTIGYYSAALPTVETELGLGFDVEDRGRWLTRRFSVPIDKLAHTDGTQVIGPHLSLAMAGRFVAEEHFHALILNASAGANYSYRYGRDPTWTFTANAPAVQAKCVPQLISKISQPTGFTWSEPPTPKDRTVTQEWIFSAAAGEGYALDQPFALWLSPSGSSSIGLFVSSGSSTNASPDPVTLDGYACAIDAWWSSAEYTISRQAPVHVTCSRSPQHCFSPASPRISINSSWAHSLSPTVSLHGQKTTVIAELLRIMFSPEYEICDRFNLAEDTFCGTMIEVAFAALIAGGASRSGEFNIPVNVLVDDFAEQFAQGGKAYRLLDSGDWPLESLDPSLAGLTHPPATSFSAKVTVQGYGFSCDSTEARVALAVLFAYCLVAVAHVVYQIGFCGWSSEAWDSIPEILALAVGSKGRGMALKDAGVGIVRLDTLRKRVRVGVREGGRVELVFDERVGGVGEGMGEVGMGSSSTLGEEKDGEAEMERVASGQRYG